jgi:type IV pilus assembly protein PilA
MYQRFHAMREEREGGFTLIELLVVILIIAILAAIAIPVFLRQRERGYEAQAQSAVKNAATAVESYATQNNGNYSGTDGWAGATVAGANNDLGDVGYSNNPDAPVTVFADVDSYCIHANHVQLANNWKFFSGTGRPVEGSCTDANG